MRPSRRGHTFPPPSAVCAGLVRIPLGRGPWLLRLRRSFRCLVRRLHSYYGLARLPMPVHHRLRLVAFPMRTANTTLRPDVGSPSFQRDRSARDVLSDPGGVSSPSHGGATHVAFAEYGPSPPPRYRHFVAQSHTPHSSCVRFVAIVTAGSRNTRLQATRYALPGLDFHQPIAPASWRLPIPTPTSSTSLSQARSAERPCREA
jgi:hypothetical protein